MDESFLQHAERLIEAEILAGIARARVRESPPPGFDGDCACGGPIPVARVELGYYRCLSCQAAREKKG